MPALVFLALVLLLQSTGRQSTPAPLVNFDFVPADEPLWS